MVTADNKAVAVVAVVAVSVDKLAREEEGVAEDSVIVVKMAKENPHPYCS